MPRQQEAPAGNRGQSDGERDCSRQHDSTAVTITAASLLCPHAHRRPSADQELEICRACGRVVQPLTRDGSLELLRLAARYGVDDLSHDGAADYGIRDPARRRLNVVPRTPAPKPPARPTRPAWGGVRVG